MTKRPAPLISTLLILAMAAYATFFTAQLLLHYYSFGSRSLDLGNMDQAIWNTLHGRPFHQTNQPGATNRLSLHVEPILLPISLLYLVYSGPEILFLFQSIVVALGAIPVFALARFKLYNDGLALIFALVYLMFPAIQGATLLDFHAITLAPTFLLAAFYYLETKRPKLFALFAILAAACKEDMTLLVMMLGFYAFFINRQRRLGLITVGLCGMWAFLAVFVIPPAFAGTENIHWDRYGHLGNSPLNIVLNFFIRPHLVLSHLQQVQALDYLRLLLTPTGFTALFNPVTLLLALPSLGINLLSNFSPMQRVNSLIYAAPIVPAVMISSIYGVANLKRMSEWRIMNSGWQVAGFTQHATRLRAKPPFGTQLFNLFFGGLILTATLVYHLFYGYLPWGGQFRGWEEVTGHHRRAERLFAQIPPEAALSAHDRLNPHVSQRETLYIFDRIEDADHIVLDVTEDSWPLHPVELRQRVDQFLGNGFGVVDAFDGYLLLAKDRSGLPATLPDAFFDFARVSHPASFQPQFPAAVTFDDKLKLLGYDLGYGAHEDMLPVITLYWQALEPLEQNFSLWPFSLDRNGKLIEDPSERPLVATLWYPTSRWSPGEIVVTRTLPWDLGDEFTLAVGVAGMSEEAKQGEGWTDSTERLPITEADSTLYLFENKSWARLGSFRRTQPHTYEAITPGLTQPAQPRQVQFWDIIHLQGVDLPTPSLSPGDSLPFTLYWQSAAPITVDLKTFAHLLDENGQVVAQLDWTPHDALGYLPTTAWQPGRPVVDRQVLPLPVQLVPGQYHLVLGWYYPVTGDRLPVTAGDVAGEGGDTAEVGGVAIR